MDKEVKPTWRLAWGLWWRMVLIGLGVGLAVTLIVSLILFAACGMSILSVFWWLF